MAEDWSLEEVAATVAEYFAMLELELRGERYSKTEHRRHLLPMLHDRSEGAVEFKNGNISAVLIDMGFLPIRGYKPYFNYQEALVDEVEARLNARPELGVLAEKVVATPADPVRPTGGLSDIIVDAPRREKDRIYERRKRPAVPRLNVNYLELEARNASLGREGEAFVLELEARRLHEAGQKDLASRVEHSSVKRGDGLGYDILSFEKTGKERFIEVKTTRYSEFTPFYATKTEVEFSRTSLQQFHLYRVFRFRESPQVFMLPGPLEQSCELDPTQYRAMVR